MEKRQRIGNLVRSIIMTVLTACLLIAITFAWYATNKVATANGGFAKTNSDQIEVSNQSVFRILNNTDKASYLSSDEATKGQLLTPYPYGYESEVKGVLDGDSITENVYYSVTVARSNASDNQKRKLKVDLQSIDGDDWFLNTSDPQATYVDSEGHKYNMCDVFEVRLNNILLSDDTVDKDGNIVYTKDWDGFNPSSGFIGFRDETNINDKVIATKRIYNNDYVWDPNYDVTLVFELRLNVDSVLASNPNISYGSLSNKSLSFKYMFITDEKVTS